MLIGGKMKKNQINRKIIANDCCNIGDWSIFALPVSPSPGVSMAAALQSTRTRTPAAASPAILVCSVTSRTRRPLTPVASLSVNMESAGCRAWARPTASVTVAIRERCVKEVRKSRHETFSLPLLDCLEICPVSQ